MNKFVFSAAWVLAGQVGGWVINEIVYLFLNRPPIGVNIMAALLPASGRTIFLIFCITKAILILKGQNPSPLVSEKYKKPILITTALYFGLIAITKIYNSTNHEGQSSVYSPPLVSSSAPSNSNSAEVPIITQPKKQLCYVYWDGTQFQIGKTEGNQFQRLALSNYGVEVIELGLPIETARALGLENAPKGELSSDPNTFNAFIGKYYSQIKNLCHIKN